MLDSDKVEAENKLLWHIFNENINMFKSGKYAICILSCDTDVERNGGRIDP